MAWPLLSLDSEHRPWLIDMASRKGIESWPSGTVGLLEQGLFDSPRAAQGCATQPNKYSTEPEVQSATLQWRFFCPAEGADKGLKPSTIWTHFPPFP